MESNQHTLTIEPISGKPNAMHVIADVENWGEIEVNPQDKYFQIKNSPIANSISTMGSYMRETFLRKTFEARRTNAAITFGVDVQRWGKIAGVAMALADARERSLGALRLLAGVSDEFVHSAAFSEATVMGVPHPWCKEWMEGFIFAYKIKCSDMLCSVADGAEKFVYGI